MPEVISIKFKDNSKEYFFDPCGKSYHKGQYVIVESSNRNEFVTVVRENFNVPECQIKGELKKVIRAANSTDTDKYEKNVKRSEYAMQIFREEIEKLGLDIKPVSATLPFEGPPKFIFTFTSDKHIEFKDISRALSSKLETRIELKQIYERDDVKEKGALGVCGRECCCAGHLNTLTKSTMKMAKNQGLAMGSSKTMGACNKLICCLCYEDETYRELSKGLPKLKSKIESPLGNATIQNVNVLQQTVLLKIEKEDSGISYQTMTLEELEDYKNGITASKKINIITPMPSEAPEVAENEVLVEDVQSKQTDAEQQKSKNRNKSNQRRRFRKPNKNTSNNKPND